MGGKILELPSDILKAEGRAEGRAEGETKALAGLVKDGIIDIIHKETPKYPILLRVKEILVWAEGGG